MIIIIFMNFSRLNASLKFSVSVDRLCISLSDCLRESDGVFGLRVPSCTFFFLLLFSAVMESRISVAIHSFPLPALLAPIDWTSLVNASIMEHLMGWPEQGSQDVRNRPA